MGRGQSPYPLRDFGRGDRPPKKSSWSGGQVMTGAVEMRRSSNQALKRRISAVVCFDRSPRFIRFVVFDRFPWVTGSPALATL